MDRLIHAPGKSPHLTAVKSLFNTRADNLSPGRSAKQETEKAKGAGKERKIDAKKEKERNIVTKWLEKKIVTFAVDKRIFATTR